MSEGGEQLLLHFLEQIAHEIHRVADELEKANSYQITCAESDFALPELEFIKETK